MEFEVIFADRPSTTESLFFVKQLSQQKVSVYQVYSYARQKNYALKAFPKTASGATQYKKEKLMFNLNHQNVIQRYPVKCHMDNSYAMLVEFAMYGDFFDIVTQGLLNTEVLIRTYFHQLIEGVEYIHSQGVAHLDLKLDNIMLGADFQLKIIDFDQAQPLTDKLVSTAGTRGYRAPEVKNGTCSDLSAADIFAAGVILFTLKAREFPFGESEDFLSKDIYHYSTFVKNNKRFWTGRTEAMKSRGIFDQDFIELVNGMLAKDPSKRFKIQDIKESTWFKGPVLGSQSLREEMRSRWECMMKK